MGKLARAKKIGVKWEQSFERSENIFPRLNSKIRTSTRREECERVIFRDAHKVRGHRSMWRGLFKRETAAQGKQLVRCEPRFRRLGWEVGRRSGMRRGMVQVYSDQEGAIENICTALPRSNFSLWTRRRLDSRWKAPYHRSRITERSNSLGWQCRVYHESIYARCIT